MISRSPADSINARLDRLPSSHTIWLMIVMLALGGWFEYYDMLFTAYIGPGLVKSGLFSATTTHFFGFNGLATFIAATFGGMLIGTSCFSFAADTYGRKTIFTFALLWYSLWSVVMAFQTTALSIVSWRFVASIGIGLELVTISTYLAELVPQHLRGRAFALCEVITFTAVPFVAMLAWLLVPHSYLGLQGWRIVVLIGAVGAAFVWLIRLGLPESPRWLASRGRIAEASAILDKIEAEVVAEGKTLPPLQYSDNTPRVGYFKELWQSPYRARMLMLTVFNFFQTVGYYGFASWLPTLLIAKGITVTTSLAYAFIIAIANPIGPALGMLIADKIERKWLIVTSALGVAVFGMLFAQQASALWLTVCGVMVVLFSTIMVFAFRAYQAELFPTRLRNQAVGFVFSFSRISAVFAGFMIAFCLGHFGVTGVFAFITFAMVMVMASIGIFGPYTKGLSLEDISK
jgi:putative MFS transporter